MDKLLELTLTISNVPTGRILGLTQGLAEDLGFTFDPWSDEESKNLNQVDIELFTTSKIESILCLISIELNSD